VKSLFVLTEKERKSQDAEIIIQGWDLILTVALGISKKNK
jgi:hypothetical protein